MLDEIDTVAFNTMHNANMLVVSIDDFHVLADIHHLLLGSRKTLMPDDRRGSRPPFGAQFLR
jgi:hypothetical protein